MVIADQPAAKKAKTKRLRHLLQEKKKHNMPPPGPNRGKPLIGVLSETISNALSDDQYARMSDFANQVAGISRESIPHAVRYVHK